MITFSKCSTILMNLCQITNLVRCSNCEMTRFLAKKRRGPPRKNVQILSKFADFSAVRCVDQTANWSDFLPKNVGVFPGKITKFFQNLLFFLVCFVPFHTPKSVFWPTFMYPFHLTPPGANCDMTWFLAKKRRATHRKDFQILSKCAVFFGPFCTLSHPQKCILKNYALLCRKFGSFIRNFTFHKKPQRW